MDSNNESTPPTQPSYVPPPTDEALLSECRVDTFRSGGKGGQHQNTTDSGVRLTHLPTGIVVISRSERSQHQNRRLALERLRTRISDRGKVAKARVPTRIPRGERERRLAEKRTRAKRKSARRPPDSED